MIEGILKDRLPFLILKRKSPLYSTPSVEMEKKANPEISFKLSVNSIP